MKPFVLSFALLWLSAVLPARTPSIPFARLSVADGLSQGTVNCILQDATGFVWLGTQDGLNRYDGVGFTVYKNDPTDPSSLPSNWIGALSLDPSGDLWVGTQGGGLARWRRATDTFERYRHDPDEPSSLPGNTVRALHLDRAGDLWVGTFQSGLARLVPASGGFESFRHDPDDPSSLPDDRVRAIHEDRAGHLWIGTLGGLSRLGDAPATGARRAFVRFEADPADPSSLSDNRVYSILEDAGGTLWVGTEDGLNRSRGTRADAGAGSGFVRFHHDPADPSSLADDWITDLRQDRAGRLWIATDGGLHLRRPEGGFDRYRHDPGDALSLSNDRVLAVFEDRGGVLWVGTQGGGVNKWNPITWSFTHYRSSEAAPGGLSSDAVFAFSEDRQGRLFVGTFGGGLDVLDRASGRFRNFRHDPAVPASLPGDQITALLHDRDEALWVGTLGRGLGRFDPAAQTFRNFRHDPERPDSLSNDDVSALAEDRDGVLWIATYRGGLNRARRGSFESFRHDPDRPDSLSNDHLTALAEDADGSLWVGSFGGGLNLLNPERTAFRRIRHDPERPSSLSSDTIYALHLDTAGTLWVGTRVGFNRLHRLDGEPRFEFEHYFERDGLPNDNVWGIRSDAAGRLWISTNNGLSRFDPATETFVNYDVSHGLQGNEFNFGAHYASPSGELFFGGTGGFNAFFPDRIESNDHVPPVVLTSLKRFNQPMVFDRPLFDVARVDLSYEDHFLAFEFAALDFTAPGKNRYRYRLEGFDEKWVDHGTERRVTFASIPPGDYTLRVQGSNNDGVWNEEGLALRVSVAPPFWQTWWFQSLAALALAAAGFAAYRIRTRAIRNRNILLEALVKERTRELEDAQEQLVRKEKLATLGELAGSLAHEIRNPLGVIKNAAYLLEVLREPDDVETKEQLDLIGQELDYSSNIIGELLDFAREPAAGRRPFTVQDAVEEAVAKVEVPAGVDLERRCEDGPLAVRADLGQVRSILVNLLQNGVQAIAGRGTVRVECRRVAGEAVVSVIDTGHGVAAADLEKIFEPLYTTKARGIGLGLSLSQRYAKINEGRIECDSEEGKGAIFRLVLPLHQEDGIEARV